MSVLFIGFEGRLRPELWLNVQFKHGLDQATDVMCKNLTKPHSSVLLCLASKTIAKLRLDHVNVVSTLLRL